jgi:hypothetical protein
MAVSTVGAILAVCLCVYVTNELSFRYFYCDAER